jgi:hypothetical protein
MKYEVRCECNKTHTVGAADAGSSLKCLCGRTIEVPPLHQLRTSEGTGAMSPLANIRSALLNNLLPGTRKCAVCGTESDNRCRVKVVCERVANQGGPSQAEVVGCLLGPSLFGWLVALLIVGGLRAQRESTGDEEAVIVPLPVCQACRPKLDNTGVLQKAVHQIPDYVALLECYPNAEIQRVA